RKRNIFDNPNIEPSFGQGSLFPSTKISNTAPPDSSPASNLGDFASYYAQLASQPEGPAQSQYRQFLSQQLPSKEQYKPGAISRIGAILSGLSTGITRGAGEGYATARGILDEPYREALESYKLQAGRLGEAAKVEQENELNRVKLARDILESQDRQRRAAIEEQVGRGRIANWESLAKSRGNSKPV